MKVLVLAEGVAADPVSEELERLGHKALIVGGRGMVASVLGAARPDALIAVSADPAAARAWLAEVAKGLPVLSLPADAGPDEVALVVSALTGSFSRAERPGSSVPEGSATVPEAGSSVPEVSATVPEAGSSVPEASATAPGGAPCPLEGVVEVPVWPAEAPFDPAPDPGTALQASPESALILAKLAEVRTGSYFEVLGLEPGATAYAARARYEALSRAFSAERFEGRVGGTFEEHLREIGRGLFDALYVLGDDELRARYAAALDGRSPGRRAMEPR